MQVVLVHFKTISLISTTWFVFFAKASSVSYGPSLVSLTRWDRLVRGPTIFNPDTGRVIILEDYPNYSVIIPLAPDSPTATSNQVFISRRVSGPGEFSVEAPQGYGVMAVIQSLDLRVAEDACNDFILFSEVDGGGVENAGTCGKVDIRDTSPSPQGLIGPRTFISDSGRMKILFYHGFLWGLVRNFNFDIFDSSLNPDLKVEIAFTAYKDCPTLNSTKSIPQKGEPEANKGNAFATCLPSVPNSKTCIRKELFCDKTLNCAFGQEFASDEDSVTCSTLKQTGHLPVPPRPLVTTGKTISTSERPTSTTTTEKLTTTTNSVSKKLSTTSPAPISKPNSISTTTEKFVEIKHNVKGTGADAAGLIGLVRRYPLLDPHKQSRSSKTIVVRGSSGNITVTRSETQLLTKKKTKSNSTTKMPQGQANLFVDVRSDPVEDPLVNGLSEEEVLLLEDNEGMSVNTIIGIASVTGIVLVLIGILRVYYCYNKVIWNPHGSRLKSGESPPDTPNTNIMRKMKALAMESEEVFNEKKGKGLKEQPPSYEILFPLPEEKDPQEKV